MDEKTTPKSYAAWKESIDDTGAVCRMEPIWDAMEALEKENRALRGLNDPAAGSACFCNCKDSEIRFVDNNRPHVAIDREGWFCMGCLAEFKPAQP